MGPQIGWPELLWLDGAPDRLVRATMAGWAPDRLVRATMAGWGPDRLAIAIHTEITDTSVRLMPSTYKYISVHSCHINFTVWI